MFIIKSNTWIFNFFYGFNGKTITSICPKSTLFYRTIFVVWFNRICDMFCCAYHVYNVYCGRVRTRGRPDSSDRRHSRWEISRGTDRTEKGVSFWHTWFVHNEIVLLEISARPASVGPSTCHTLVARTSRDDLRKSHVSCACSFSGHGLLRVYNYIIL